MLANVTYRFPFFITVLLSYLFFYSNYVCAKQRLFSIEYSDERNDVIQEESNKVVTVAKPIRRNSNVYNRGNLQEIFSHPNDFHLNELQGNDFQRNDFDHNNIDDTQLTRRRRGHDMNDYKWVQTTKIARTPARYPPLALSLKYTTAISSIEEEPAWNKVYLSDDIIKKKLISVLDKKKQSDPNNMESHQIYRALHNLPTTRYKLPVDSLELIRAQILKWKNERGYTETTPIPARIYVRNIQPWPSVDRSNDEVDDFEDGNIDKEYLRNEILSFLAHPGDKCSDAPKGTCVEPGDCKKASLRIPIRDYYCDGSVTFTPKLICCMIYKDIREVLSAMYVSSVSDNSWETSFSDDETQHGSSSFGDSKHSSCSKSSKMEKSKRDKKGNKMKTVMKRKKQKKHNRRRYRH